MPSYPGGIGLFVGVPHDGKPITINWAFHLANFHPPMNYDTRFMLLPGHPVDEARCILAEEALKVNAKYLYFNDTDVTVPSHGLRQLIWHLDHYPKYAVAGGIYCHKAPPQAPMVFRGNGIGPFLDWKVGEVFDVSGIGMGATLIRVDALRKLSKPWFKTVDCVDDFMEGINRASMWTEDLYFCHKLLTETDYKIMADGGLLCVHWDNMAGKPYHLPLNSKPWTRTPTLGKKIIDLGCGKLEDSYRTDEGTVLRVDIREDAEPDYRCDIRKLPFATGEFDVVFSCHVLEHFPRTETSTVLDEMIRIMKLEGELRLILPNMTWAAQHIMNGEIDPLVMAVLYGEQSYEENFHQTGFTPQMIEQLLTQKGFKKFIWNHYDFHMCVRAFLKEEAVPTELVSVWGDVKCVMVAQHMEQQKAALHDPAQQQIKLGDPLAAEDSSVKIEVLPELATPEASSVAAEVAKA